MHRRPAPVEFSTRPDMSPSARRAASAVPVLLLSLLLGAIPWAPAAAQSGSASDRTLLLAYFPFDGGSVEEAARGIPSDVLVIQETSSDGFGIKSAMPMGRASSTGKVDRDGRYGEALSFTSDSRFVLAPLDLDFATHPQITVSMWVKIWDEEAGERGVLLSTGNGADYTPRLSLRQGHVVANAAGSQLPNYAGELQVGTWTHVAAIWDSEADRVRVYTGGAGDERTGLDKLDPVDIAARRRSQTAIENPFHPDWLPTRHLVIGSLTADGYNRLSGVSIDEVRIWAGALSEKELADIMAAESPPPLGPVAPPPAPPAVAETEVIADNDPAGSGAGGGTATDAGSDTGTDEGSGSGAESGEGHWVATISDAFHVSDVSGTGGDRHQTADLGTAALGGIQVHERQNRPCRLVVFGSRNRGPKVSGEQCKSALLAQTWQVTMADDYYVNSLQVCHNDRSNHRVKGIRIWGRKISIDNRTGEARYEGEANSAMDTLPNCRKWAETVSCDRGEFATGVRVHFSRVGPRTRREQIVGVALVCRTMETKRGP